MNTALEALMERGFVSQCTGLEALSARMDSGTLTFYVGCDPTGRSLHVGHMVPFFAFRHLVGAGHRGVALIGEGTARVGDPSGKTESRRMLDYAELAGNARAVRAQLGRFLGAEDGGRVIFDNNKEWLAGLNYIDFLREIGSHFSVNRMLSFEAYKARLERGLSFVEFNYQLLQSYDFLQLYRRHGCRLQIGGDDQWGNIVAGLELIRRLEGRGGDGGGEAFGLTFPLVTTADGAKMGKTEKGAVFLDPALTAPYDFFQYWRDARDADVPRFLLLFTFLPADECRALCAAPGGINAAKERLAWEVTALVHGKAEADAALSGARAAFGGGGDGAGIPAKELPRARFEAGYNVVDLFCDAGLCASKSEARRLVAQGGARAGSRAGALEAVTDIGGAIGISAFDSGGGLLLAAGKKRFCRVTPAD